MATVSFKLEDQTGRLTATERQQLERVLAEDVQKSGVELNVLVVNAVADRAFRQHAVEQRRRLSTDYTNSILVVVDMGDRHVEIATAPQYSEKFTPTVTNRLLVKSAVPFLRDGQLANGIAATLDAVTDLLMSKTATGGTTAVQPKKLLAIVGLIVALIGGIFGFQSYRNHTCRGCGAWGSYAARELRAATSSQAGLREHSFHCNRCQTNYTWQTSVSYSDSSSSSSDSGGGGGGGGDGGGGADF